MSAKTLAYATGCAILGIETFAAIALQTPNEARQVDVLADAQQKKVYVQRWRRDDAEWRPESKMVIQPIADWLGKLEPGVWVSGPGIRLCESSIPAANPVVSERQREPGAESLLALGWKRWQRGERDDVFQLEPLYLRPSNAEENWDRRKQEDKGNVV